MKIVQEKIDYHGFTYSFTIDIDDFTITYLKDRVDPLRITYYRSDTFHFINDKGESFVCKGLRSKSEGRYPHFDLILERLSKVIGVDLSEKIPGELVSLPGESKENLS